MSSGALVLVDLMFVPRVKPFMDRQHVVYYDNMNKTSLFSALDEFWRNKVKREEIALRGWETAWLNLETWTLNIEGALEPLLKPMWLMCML